VINQNLLLNTQSERTIKAGALTLNLTPYAQQVMAAGETTVTISFDAKSDMETAIDHYPREAAGAWANFAASTDITTQWQRYSHVYTYAPKAYTQFSIRSNTNVTGGGGSNAATVSIRNIKLEFGNEATPWVPAAEDGVRSPYSRCVLREAGDGGMIITVEGLT